MVKKSPWEAIGENITTKSRLTDTYEIGKVQYNQNKAIAKTSYEDQLAKMREETRRSADGFDAGQAARGVAGSGFGYQNIWNRAVGIGQAEGTLKKNYDIQLAQLDTQQAGAKTQYDTGLKDADINLWYKTLAFNEGLLPNG